jgi:hypothetical protein
MTAEITSASRGGIGTSITDGLLVGWRNLKRIPRIPELAIFAILQSIMFVLLFAYVFGGRDPAAGRRLVPRVPDARDLYPDAGVRLDDDRDCRHRRHGEGPDRPLPVAADGALGGAGAAAPSQT